MKTLTDVPARLIVAIHRASSADTVRALWAHFGRHFHQWDQMPLATMRGSLDLNNFVLTVLIDEGAASDFLEALQRATAHEAPFSVDEVRIFRKNNPELFRSRGLVAPSNRIQPGIG